jgi:hypothetical protein
MYIYIYIYIERERERANIKIDRYSNLHASFSPGTNLHLDSNPEPLAQWLSALPVMLVLLSLSGNDIDKKLLTLMNFTRFRALIKN